MTPSEAVEKLLAFKDGDDQEDTHHEAEGILLDVLAHLGHPEVGEAFVEARCNVRFWYS